MASALNEESVEKKLKTVNNTQDSIQSLSLWIIHHKTHHAKIVELWMKVMKKTVHPSHRLTLFYLCNDVVQNCKKKKAYVYNAAFKEHLIEAAGLVRDLSVKAKVERIFNIWGERGVYDVAFIKNLHGSLNGQAVKSKKGHRKKVQEKIENAPISPAPTPQVDFVSKETAAETQAVENMTERDAEESARILAEFKPHEMIDQITAFKRQEAEIRFKFSQLTHLKLDASSLEAVKQLKDRAHGNDFSSQFEDSCSKLEDIVKRQTQHLEDQHSMLETLKLSETFYEEQYREAKIVANAYKNFGARINNMKKKLDELKRSFPEPDSPIPSPDVNAPSPGNTPPHVGYGYNPAAPSNYGHGVQQNAWMYNGSGSSSGASAVNSMGTDNAFPESPPLEAPSPEGSPPGLNLDGSENVSGSLESRLASFFDRGRNDSSNPPVYTPQLPRSLSSSNKLKLGDEDGSTTPLDDEAPTTPVQDENLASPPKRNTPPKRENPIDFLSRLISQTQKAPAKTGQASFLDSLTMLTSVGKKPAEPEVPPPGNPQSWAAWKAKSNDNTSPSQPSSPTAYGVPTSQPTSPVSFPPTPTMVPPPIPMPVPPPLSMGLSIPPPPPPPFGLAAGMPQHFSTPPPGFQQTSPGQKENWPDVKRSQASDHTSTSRAGHTSVLKELVPADGMESKSGSHLLRESTTSMIDSDAMEIVSEEEDEVMMGTAAEAGGEAKAEFAQKLKQKTSSQSSLKSHVFVPNPERPNLMTLTVPDDLDEEDMIDDNTVMEEAPSWPSKPQKSSRKSRSRSHSREKERSHKHKKKKKHKRNHSDEEDSRHSETGGDEGKGLGSVVKKIDGHSSRNSRDSKGDKHDDRRFDKYDDDRKYDRYDDRKYDRYDDRGYGSRGDYKSYKGQRGSKDAKDPVEAYTQAYRDAFFQQYSQGRFNPFAGGSGSSGMDPRRSGHGKY